MRRIGNYTVEDEPLARGGMGQIFKGCDPLGHNVAIKEILPEFASDWSIINRIEKEVEFLMKMEHPSIVRLYAAFRDVKTGCYYIVMEMVEGLNLEQYVAKHGAIPYKKATDLMIKVLEAMYCVHSASIVHRDLKPSNIMIRDNGDICLLDFGVAKDMATQNGLTVFGSIIGTNGYMSPEQANGMAIDYRSDIYSLGCVFYYMLTGHHAFDTLSSEFETKDAIINLDFPPLSKYKSGLPDTLQKVLERATAKNMTHRYRTCYDFLSSLRNGTHVSDVTIGSTPIMISIGREKCDIILSDPDHKISRHHADIELKEFTGGKYFIFTDCSSNGTLVNDKFLNKKSIQIPAHMPYAKILLARVPEGRLDWTRVEEEIEKKRRSLELSDDEIDDVANDKSNVESDEGEDVVAATEESGKTMLFLAYILSLIGVGMIFGIVVATNKRTDPAGEKTFTYTPTSRQLGWGAVGASVFFMLLWVGAYL